MKAASLALVQLELDRLGQQAIWVNATCRCRAAMPPDDGGATSVHDRPAYVIVGRGRSVILGKIPIVGVCPWLPRNNIGIVLGLLR